MNSRRSSTRDNASARRATGSLLALFFASPVETLSNLQGIRPGEPLQILLPRHRLDAFGDAIGRYKHSWQFASAIQGNCRRRSAPDSEMPAKRSPVSRLRQQLRSEEKPGTLRTRVVDAAQRACEKRPADLPAETHG